MIAIWRYKRPISRVSSQSLSTPFSLSVWSSGPTVAVGLHLDYLSIIYIGDWLNSHTIAQINHKIAVFFDSSYTSSSLWYLSAVVASLYAAYVYREMRRLSLNASDEVSTSNISYHSSSPLISYYFGSDYADCALWRYTRIHPSGCVRNNNHDNICSGRG